MFPYGTFCCYIHVAGSSNAEVMMVAQFVQTQASKPGSNHYAMMYAFLTTFDIDSSIRRIIAHRWYDVTIILVYL